MSDGLSSPGVEARLHLFSTPPPPLSQAIKDVSEHRAIDAERLKVELKQSYDMNQRLKEDNEGMEEQLKWQKQEKKNLLERIEGMGSSIDEILEKNAEYERIIEVLAWKGIYVGLL